MLVQGEAHLFMPRLPEVYAVWMGPLKGPLDIKAKWVATSSGCGYTKTVRKSSLF